MYDMTGFDYDITDVANLLRLHKRRGNYYDCPFCGDTKGRLNINPAKNVFRCNRCDKSGGMLQLYADLHNLTYREANEEIREALNKGEYRQVRQAKVQEEKEEPVQSKLAPLDERHRTYTELLDRLPLYSVHRENLRSRGLTIEQIKSGATGVFRCTGCIRLQRHFRRAAACWKAYRDFIGIRRSVGH